MSGDGGTRRARDRVDELRARAAFLAFGAARAVVLFVFPTPEDRTEGSGVP